LDSLTQAVLGAALQGAVLGRIQGRRSLFYGAALATLPDLDVLIRYADPVSQMTFHRGFSHSLFVLTGLALLMAWTLAWLGQRYWPHKGYRWPRLFLAFWLVLVTHPILDAFTVYGTQLLWPLQPTPQSWAAVFIIDPVYTVPLLLAVLYAAFKGLQGRAVGVLAWRWRSARFTWVWPGRAHGCRAAFQPGAGAARYRRKRGARGADGFQQPGLADAGENPGWRLLRRRQQPVRPQPPEMLRQSRNLEAGKVLAGWRCTSACAGSPATGCVTTWSATRWWSPTCAWACRATTVSASRWPSVTLPANGR
jgi:inner membrane protein